MTEDEQFMQAQTSLGCNRYGKIQMIVQKQQVFTVKQNNDMGERERQRVWLVTKVPYILYNEGILVFWTLVFCYLIYFKVYIHFRFTPITSFVFLTYKYAQNSLCL